MTVNFRSDMEVELRRHCGGGDASVIEAMLVSTKPELREYLDSNDSQADEGRINFLMRDRHASPFRHNIMTFYMEVPIFVSRQLRTHHVGWAFSERSGRYSEMTPDFYIPRSVRPMRQVGKPGRYEFVEHESPEYILTEQELAAWSAWRSYQRQLANGAAKEVARSVLPQSLYTQLIVSCNANSLMTFLSLRQRYDDAKYTSFPQVEINMLADHMELVFAQLFPITHAKFVEHGRVAP